MKEIFGGDGDLATQDFVATRILVDYYSWAEEDGGADGSNEPSDHIFRRALTPREARYVRHRLGVD